MQFEFATATRIVFGSGKLAELGKFARPFGTRALVVTGRNLQRAQAAISTLSREEMQVEVFSVGNEPTIEDVMSAVDRGRESNAEVVLGVGGGSAIDAAKATAAMLANPGQLLDYLEVVGQGKPLPNAPLPFIAVPTTAGTGSEVTRNAVLGSKKHGVKVSLRSPSMLAKVALVDPELTLDLPPALTASTGLDALTQCIEAYVSCRATPMTDGLCEEGIRRAARSLRRAYENGRDLGAREDMALASLFSGLALANAGLGAVHGFAGPIGGLFPAPHGAVCAALLPHVMQANVRALWARDKNNPALPRYTTVARLLTGDPSASQEEGVKWTQRLVSNLQVPQLSSHGVEPAAIPGLVERSTRASSMKGNPLPLTQEELTQILTAAI